MRAETIADIGRAGLVGVGSLVADASASAGNLVDPLVRTIHAATIARANTTAVQNVLDRQVDVNALSLAGNLDTITKSRHSAVSPAAAAVLGNVLVTRHGAEVGAVQVAPGECLRKTAIGHGQTLVAVGEVATPIDASSLSASAVPHFGDTALHNSSRAQGNKGKNAKDHSTHD